MSTSEFRLEFDIAPVQIPCRIDGKEYVLGKASAAAATAHKAGMLKFAGVGKDGEVQIQRLGPELMELDFPLLASCLCHAELHPNGTIKEKKGFLTTEEVTALPNDAQVLLVERVKKMSGMEPVLPREELLKQRIEIDRKLSEADQLKEITGEDPLDGSPKSTTDGSD